MTIAVLVDGFEHEYLGLSGQNPLYASAALCSIDTSAPISGRASLRIAPVAQIGRLVYSVGTSTVMVVRFKLRLNAIPTANVTLAGVNVALGGSPFIRYNATDGKLHMIIGAGPDTASAFPALGVGQVYNVEYRADCSGASTIVDWSINGLAQTKVTFAQAATTFSTFYLGQNVASTFDVTYDDVVVSNTAGDYPIGDGVISALLPAGTSTPSANAGDFDTTTDSGATHVPVSVGGAIDVAQYLADLPISDASRNIRQIAANGASYLPIPFEDLAAATRINSVRAIAVYRTDGSTANNAAIVVRRLDGVETGLRGSSGAPTLFGVDPSPRTAWAVIAPPVGGWTLAEVNGLTARFGFSTDVVPPPIFDGIVFEVDVARPQILLPTALGMSSGSWTGSAAGLADADDATAIVSPVDPAAGTYQGIALSAGQATAVKTDHVLTVRHYKSGPRACTHTYELRQGSGGAVIASFGPVTLPDVPTTATYTLTTAQATAITDYATLYLRVNAVSS